MNAARKASWNASTEAWTAASLTTCGDPPAAAAAIAAASGARAMSRSVSTVARIATPIEEPTWRSVLNSDDARPVLAGEIVANAAACNGMNVNAIATPRVQRIAMIHQIEVSA